MEQALLEVEEESEMEAMHGYKAENKGKKIEEQKSWAHMVREEAEKISQKNLVFQAARTKYVKTMNLISKLQNLNLAKTYLSNLVPSVLNEHTQPFLHSDYFPHVLHNHYLPFVLEGTISYLSRKESLKTIPQQIVNESSSSMIENRAKIVKQHKQKARKEQIRSINFSEKQRLVRFLYINPKFIVQSEFTMRINYTLKGEDYPENLNDSVLLKDSERKEDSNIIEEKPDKPEWAKYPTFYIDEIKRLSFVIANHPILDTPKDLRKYGFFAEFYAETGELLYSVDSSTAEVHSGVKINANCRDLTKKTSDDEMIILNMSALSKDVHNIFLYSYTARPSPTEFKYARYQLLDFTTYQKLDHRTIKADDFQPDENGLSAPLYLAYRIFRTEKNPRSLKIKIEGETPVVENTENDQH